MLIKSLVYKKDYLTIVDEKATLEEVPEIPEDSGCRCISILDDGDTVLHGNICKMHICRHKPQGGDISLSVTYLLKNATKIIKVDSPFSKVLFNIKDLLYIAILDEDNRFYGVLTYNHLLSTLSDAWNLKPSPFVLIMLSDNERDNLIKMPKIISEYTNLASVITLDGNLGTSDYVRRTLFILPTGVSEETLRTVVGKFEKKGYVIAEIEDLQTGMTIRKDKDPNQPTL